jgi:hypothetical protein
MVRHVRSMLVMVMHVMIRRVMVMHVMVWHVSEMHILADISGQGIIRPWHVRVYNTSKIDACCGKVFVMIFIERDLIPKEDKGAYNHV